MTRKQDRLASSYRRSEQERQRRLRRNLTIFCIAFSLEVVVPMLWYGAIEFGWVKPLQNQNFINSVRTFSIFVTGALLWTAMQLLDHHKHVTKLRKLEEAKIETEAEGESHSESHVPNTA